MTARTWVDGDPTKSLSALRMMGIEGDLDTLFAYKDAPLAKAKIPGGSAGQAVGTADGTTLSWLNLSGVTPVGVKTGAYTANAGELVPVDTTAGAVPITLPTAPADGSQIIVKQVAGTNTTTILRSGTAVFNVAAGATSLTLTAAGTGLILRYAATPGIWYSLDSFPLNLVGSSFAPAVPVGGGSYVSTLSPLFQTVPRLQFAASATMDLTWLGAVTDINSAVDTTITLPSTATVPWLDNGVATLANINDGIITLAPAAGVSFIPADARLKLAVKGASGSLRKLPGGAVNLPATGLLMRFKADSIAGANGSVVTSWPESSGLGHPAAVPPLVGNQPTLLTNSLNGHNTVAFDGGNDYLSLSGSALTVAQNKGALMIMIAYVYPSVASGVRSLFGLSSGTSSTAVRTAVYHRDSGGFRGAGGRRLDANTAAFISGTASVAGQAEQLAAVFDWTNSDLVLYQNGTSAASNLAFQTAGSSENTASLAGVIGANLAGASEFFFGRIAEILVYSAVDATTRAQVGTYFQSTYGIAASDAVAVGDVWFKEGAWT